MATLQSKNGPVGTYETTAKWSVGEGKTESASGTLIAPAEMTKAGIIAFLNTLGDDAMIPLGNSKVGFGDALLYGLDLKRKAQLRPAAAVDSPWIVRDEIRINLSTGERIKKDGSKATPLPIEKVIGAVNSGIKSATDLGGEPQAAFLVARRLLLESKAAVEKNGVLVAASK